MTEVRQTGMILAIELVKDKAHRVPYPWQERRGRIVYVHQIAPELPAEALRLTGAPRAHRLCPWPGARGVVAATLGCHLFHAPLCDYEDEIRFMAEAATEGIERATAE